MKKPSKIIPKNHPPASEKSDKVLKELREKTEETFDLYNSHLNGLHALFGKEPPLASEETEAIMRMIRSAIGIERNGFASKIYGKLQPIINILTPWNRKQRMINDAVYKYLELLNKNLVEFNAYKYDFHTALLHYTQQVAPLMHDLNSQVAREITVFPVERMDLIFLEQMRQIEQLKTEVERLKKRLDEKEHTGSDGK